jgi:hypothetical protein
MTESELEKAAQTATQVKEENRPVEQEPSFDPLAPFLTILNLLTRPRNYLSAAPTFVPQNMVDQIQFVDDGVDKWIYVYVNKTWVGIKNGSGGSGAPGGSNKHVQFNDAGVFGGDSQFTYDKSTHALTLATLILSNALNIAYGGTGATSAAGARANLGAQAQDNDLDALAAISATGFLVRTGTGTAAARTLVAGSNVTITNPDGVSGNPVISATISGSNSRVRVYLSADQNYGGTGYERINFDTEAFDGNSEYDNATNYRFTATSDGYYLVNVKVTSNRTNNTVDDAISLFKNGSAIDPANYFIQRSSTGAYEPFALLTTIVFLSASDYIDVRASLGSFSTPKIRGGSGISYLEIHRLS